MSDKIDWEKLTLLETVRKLKEIAQDQSNSMEYRLAAQERLRFLRALLKESEKLLVEGPKEPQ